MGAHKGTQALFGGPSSGEAHGHDRGGSAGGTSGGTSGGAGGTSGGNHSPSSPRDLRDSFPSLASGLASGLAAPFAAAAQSASTPTPELVDVEYIILGGITDFDGVEFLQVEADANVPELPVEYDGEPPAPEGGSQ